MAMNNIRFTYEEKNELFGDKPKESKEKEGIGFLISKYERNRAVDQQQETQIQKKKVVYHGNSLNYSQIYSDLRIDRRQKKVIQPAPMFMESSTEDKSLNKKDQIQFQSAAAYVPKSLPKIKRNSRLSHHKQSKYVINNTLDQSNSKDKQGLSRTKVFSISHYDIYKNDDKRQELVNSQRKSQKKGENSGLFGKNSGVLSSSVSKDIHDSNLKVNFENKAENNFPEQQDILQASNSTNFIPKPALQIQPQHSLQQLNKEQIKLQRNQVDKKKGPSIKESKGVDKTMQIKQQIKDQQDKEDEKGGLAIIRKSSVGKNSKQIKVEQIKRQYSDRLNKLDKKSQLLARQHQKQSLKEKQKQKRPIKVQDIATQQEPITVIKQIQGIKFAQPDMKYQSNTRQQNVKINSMRTSKVSNSKLEPATSKQTKEKEVKEIKLFQPEQQKKISKQMPQIKHSLSSIQPLTHNEGMRDELSKFKQQILKVKKQINGVKQQMHQVKQQVEGVRQEIHKQRKQSQKRQTRKTIQNMEIRHNKSRVMHESIKQQPRQQFSSKKQEVKLQKTQRKQNSSKDEQLKGDRQEVVSEQVNIQGQDTNRTYQFHKFSINDYIQVYQILKKIQKALKVPQIDLHSLIKEAKQYLQVIAMGGLDHLQGYQMPLHRLKIIKNALLYERISVVIIAFAYAVGKIKDCLKYLINLVGYATNNTLLILKILQGTQINTQAKNPVLAKSDRLVLKRNYDTIRNNSDIILDSIFKISKYQQAFYEPFKDILKSIGKNSIEQTFYNILQYFSFFLCVSDLYKNLPFLAVAPNPYLRQSIDKKPTLVIDIIQVFCQGTKKSKNHVFRPHTQHFLHEMAQYYEIISFTCAYPNQIDKVIDILDQKHNIKHRLYRHHALMTNNSLYKDPQRIGRDLSKLILLDSQTNLLRQECINTIVVPAWKGNKSDTTLAELCPILAAIALKKLDCRQATKRIHEQQVKNEHAGIKYLNFGINLE